MAICVIRGCSVHVTSVAQPQPFTTLNVGNWEEKEWTCSRITYHLCTSHTSVHVSAMDNEDDDDVMQDGLGPAKALVAAQLQEHARVSLYEALKTTLRIFQVRGFAPKLVGATRVSSQGEALKALEEFENPSRAVEGEIVLEGEVPDPPERYTTAWALGYPAGTRIAAVFVKGGNVAIMRSIVEYVQSLGIQHAIILHRNDLTAPARKYISDEVENVQNMPLNSLQAAIDSSHMTPPHLPMNKGMTDRVIARYGSPDKFPKLLTSDAMVRFLGLTKGSVVMTIERVGSGAPEHRWNQIVEA